MAPPSTTGNLLRERAFDLRRTASALGRTTAISLYQRSDVDTWIGPTARACYDDLSKVRTSLLDATDKLRAVAIRLELRADQADHEAARILAPVAIVAFAQ